MRLVHYNSVLGEPVDLARANLHTVSAYRMQLTVYAARIWGSNPRKWRIVQQERGCLVPVKAVATAASGVEGEVIVAE